MQADQSARIQAEQEFVNHKLAWEKERLILQVSFRDYHAAWKQTTTMKSQSADVPIRNSFHLAFRYELAAKWQQIEGVHLM